MWFEYPHDDKQSNCEDFHVRAVVVSFARLRVVSRRIISNTVLCRYFNILLEQHNRRMS